MECIRQGSPVERGYAHFPEPSDAVIGNDLHPFSQPFITEDSQLCCWLGLLRFSFPLFGLCLCFAFGHWVNASGEYLPRCKVKFAGAFERDKRVLTEVHVFFCAIEPIAPDPELRTGRWDEETQPATISHLVLFGPWRCVVDFLNGHIPQSASKTGAVSTPTFLAIVPHNNPHTKGRMQAPVLGRPWTGDSLNY
jgi:hypothetical protein